MDLGTTDLTVLALYGACLLGIALYVSGRGSDEESRTEDYFLAGKQLPWWAIGASLVAANISAEQIIGQSGQGFMVGVAIAAYEWQAAIVLLIVARYFLPIFLKRGIYTMPQFLQQRYGSGVRMLMSVYWIVLYTSINLTTVLWLGGLSVSSVMGVSVFTGMCGLAAFSILYSVNGGLKAVALTDIIQLAVLLVGGAAITVSALSMVGGGEGGPVLGFKTLIAELPEHFQMILSRDHPAYEDLPGIWTLLGGLWVLHLCYWGFNQYIIQRALGARSLQEAQNGLAFAAFLKLLVPLIVVLPGIAMVSLVQQGLVDGSGLDPAICGVPGDPTTCGKPDRVYAELMRLTPSGFRGLVFAALIAAIVSSLASMMNSIATIFTMDIYRRSYPERPERHYVTVGRFTAAAAMILALFLAQPFVGGYESGFQTVQEYSGFVAPGIVAVFLLGFFWKGATAQGAFAALISSLLLNVALKLGAASTPFVIRIWIVFLVCLVAGVIASRLGRRNPGGEAVDVSDISFETTPLFNGLSLGIAGLLVLIYVVLW